MPVPSVSPIELGLIPVGEDITVTIPAYEPHNPGWLETLYITHVPPGGGSPTIFRTEQFAGSQGGTYTVKAAELEQFNGRGPIQIHYTTNDGAAHILGGGALAVRSSAILGAQVGERTADMPAPRLQGAMGNNVDPADVPGKDVLVTFTYLGTQNGDTLHWSCIGSSLDGSADGTIEINNATAGKELPYPVSRDILDKNLNGSLRISYSLERTGPPKVVLRSEVLMLTVGKGVELDRPIIEGASTSPDELNPLAAISGTRVIVKFRPMLASDFITVDWITADHHGSFADNVAGDPSTHEVSVWIDARTIARGIREGGNTINVQYHFHRGTLPYESVIVPLWLLPLTGLPTPTIEGISGPILDFSQLSPTARTYIPVWSFIHAEQLMWMTYESKGVVLEDTYTANEVTEDGVLKGINPPTPVDKIKLLEDGADLTIKFWVSLAERSDKNTAVLFGIRSYTIKKLPELDDHTNFEMGWNGWRNLINGNGVIRNIANNNFWYAEKLANQNNRPGLIKRFKDIQENTTYEIRFDFKFEYDPYQPLAVFTFGSDAKGVFVSHGKNWITVAQVFTLPSGFPTQDLDASIYFSTSSTSGFCVDNLRVRKLQ